MQPVVHLNLAILRPAFEQAKARRGVVTSEDIGGRQHVPLRKLSQSISPLSESGFAPVYFLATSNERHYDRPILAPIHHFKHHPSFRHGWPFCSFVLLCIPCPLCLVKDNYVLRRALRLFAIILISEPVDIVNEGLDLKSRVPASDRTPIILCLRRVSKESLLEDFEQWPIA